MYADYKDKKEIIFWFFGNKDVIKSKKRPRSPGGGEPTKRATHQSDAHKEKMEEVDQILEKLKSKHCSFSEEKRAWAHLIQMQKHSSYDPPDMPYLKKCNKKAPDNSTLYSIIISGRHFPMQEIEHVYSLYRTVRQMAYTSRERGNNSATIQRT